MLGLLSFWKLEAKIAPKIAKTQDFGNSIYQPCRKKRRKIPALIDLTELGDGDMNIKVLRLLIYSISSMVLLILKCYAY